MTLRDTLAVFDPPQADQLTDDQRDWLLVVATTRTIFQARQAAIEQRIAEVAGTSSAQVEDVDARRRREFWAAVTPRESRVVVFGRRQA